MRAQLWTTYIASLAPYPAHVVIMDAPLEAKARACFSEAFGLGTPRWLPASLLSGLGILYQVPGAPRCLVSAARGVAAGAALRGEFWGPPPALREALALLARLQHWADTFPPPLLQARGRSALLTPAAAALTLRAVRDGHTPAAGVRVGQALYVAAWAEEHYTTARGWLTHHSLLRAWAPSLGTEWALLGGATGLTAAFHILRLLCNGLPGRARRRPNDLRQPHICTACSGPACAVWATTSPLGAGAEWCVPCLGAWATSSERWAALPDACLHPDLIPRAAAIRQALGPFPHPLTPIISMFGCCPLCGLGEAGAEHLWTWCAAVSLAWSKARPATAPITFASACLDPGDHTAAIAQFCHQISYWYSIAVWTPPLGIVRTVSLVMRSLRRVNNPGDVDDDEAAHEHPPFDAAAPPDDLWTRSNRRCPACLPSLRLLPRLHGSGRSAAASSCDRVGVIQRALVTCTAAIQGHPALVLHSEGALSGWMPPGSRWLPPPRVVSRGGANAEWHEHWCWQCRHYAARLIPNAHLAPNVEITVPRALTPGPDDGLLPFEITFDGGARSIGGRPKVAGGGAILWGWAHDGGTPRALASIVVALPQEDDTMLAESFACCRGLASLCDVRLHGHPKAVRIVGDNLPVVRFGASTGRLRNLRHSASLSAQLGSTLSAGWRLTWNGVRRQFNKGADSLATLGVLWADALHSQGASQACWHVVWHNENPPPLPPSFPPVSPSLLLSDVRPVVDRICAAAAISARSAAARSR